MTALPMSEDDLKTRVMDLATRRGWHVVHIRPARTVKGWRTPYEGDSGLPDLILARDGNVLLAELKSQEGQPTDDQKLWLAAAGKRGRLWRPSDWPAIMKDLT